MARAKRKITLLRVTHEPNRALKLSEARICGEDLTDTPCLHHERRTKIDIVFEKVVEHVDAELKQCPRRLSENRSRSEGKSF